VTQVIYSARCLVVVVDPDRNKSKESSHKLNRLRFH